jgi:hypothetical protein
MGEHVQQQAGHVSTIAPRAGAHAVIAVIVLALAALALLLSPSAAPAFEAYQHGPIEDCETCHENAHTDRPPLDFVCYTCHTDYRTAQKGGVCWTCHTPGQDMGWARTDAACLTTCHLRSADRQYTVPFTHTVHAGGSTACTTCHSVAATLALSGGSAHHTVPAPRLDTVTPASASPGATVTLAGAKFSWITIVRFGGVKAAFKVVSDTSISATVPADAVSGRVTVVGAGGLATSAGDFTVLRPQPPQQTVLTLAASRRTVAPGGRVKLTGTLAPSDPGQLVRVVVQRRVSGAWKVAASSSRPVQAGGAFSWTYRALRAGQYRSRATVEKASSAWVFFRAR